MSDLGPCTRPGSRPRWGLLLLGAAGGAGLALCMAAAPFVAPALRRVCLPFVPASEAQVETALQLLRGRRGALVDIGSGDGSIVIAAAKQGFRAVGYELNPWLVWYSRYRAGREGVHHNTRFYISDLWKVNFSEYNNVIFGVPQMMQSLESKLESELKGNARVVAYRFPFPSWIAVHESGKGIDTVWLYDAKSFKTAAK
ncbi:LOW QUALITY PROTEIN: ATP synthase subunit C lysine N-methyltransferase-like [Scyliorhinus canicula]|uniref:LOW QUALITY PROTEIN: ATP synthase subunit C lysine N-methyltransferase-like n=1 Tax=Scyliorhinus canicula TaxID=7830 RepID=UPI0018F3C8DD|nr:LOW QUALITY PROTEIN: ATP synthase subunit C lysine N-methyltransferase-like [Scyliorhinus canicula]